jgi:hypothetical protein
MYISVGLYVLISNCCADTEAKITKVVFDETQPNSAIAQQVITTAYKHHMILIFVF